MIKTLLVLLVVIFCAACRDKSAGTGGLSPDQALSSFQLPDGFKIELVASEPMIADPVAMDVDEYGNLYVVELHGYPLDTAGSGKIKLLTDTNGDGAPDKATLFADHLRMPTGIMRWKKGVMVVDVPDIIYLEDSDHDGLADIKKVVITGIALTNPQHIANTPIFGLDNWIYIAHMGTVTPRVALEFNDSGSLVRFVDNATAKQLPRNADGRNIRFKPDSHHLEMLSGQSQYGHTFDNWGHHICTDNSDHLYHEVIAARYLQRNPGFKLETASDYIPDHGNNCEVYPITVNPENQLLTGRGIVTSSCGVTWYQGGLFPDSFNNVTFIAEPVSNIVHADRIIEKGATFMASRVYQKREFLASKDGWFRPVQFYIGPDGAVYVIDYYRQIIEHPEWLSDDVINSGALYNGADKGRIYRITPTATAKMNWCNKVNLGNSTTDELVNSLSSNNIWWRRNAQRLLLDRKDPKAVGLLKNLAESSLGMAAVHAIWALEGFQALDRSTLMAALHHPEAGVRENAIQLAEIHFTDFPGMEDELIAMKDDSSPKVRYQLLCTLGGLQDAASEAACQNILMKDIEDPWVHVAILSSLQESPFGLLENSIHQLSLSASPGRAKFLTACAELVGHAGNTDDIKKVIRTSCTNNTKTSDWWQSACLKGLWSALSSQDSHRENMVAEKSLLLSKFSIATPPLIRGASMDLLSVMGITDDEQWHQALVKAKAAAENIREEGLYRNDAIRLLGMDKSADYRPLLERIIRSDDSLDLRQTALFTYNQLTPKSASEFLVRNWKDLPRDLHDAAMDIFLSSAANTVILLDAVKNGIIPSTSLGWAVKEQLANNDDENIRNRSRDLIISEIESREKVYSQYLPVLNMKGDSVKGLDVFKTVCAVCHQYQGEYGKSFGPDLGSIRNREKASIMNDILNPNRSIAVNYDLWIVTEKSGKKLRGIMSSATSSSITLTILGGQHTTISRTDIKSMETAEASAMPVGLETSISKEQMANLLRFLTEDR